MNTNNNRNPEEHQKAPPDGAKETPEVDAAVTGNSDVTNDVTNEEYEDLAYLARTLELQRNALRREVSELRAALDLGQENCDAVYDDLKRQLEAHKVSLSVARSARSELTAGRDQLRAQLQAATQELEGLRAIVGADTPWPIETLLKALVVAEDKLKADGRDFDGWESIHTAAQVARSRLAARTKETPRHE